MLSLLGAEPEAPGAVARSSEGTVAARDTLTGRRPQPPAGVRLAVAGIARDPVAVERVEMRRTLDGRAVLALDPLLVPGPERMTRQDDRRPELTPLLRDDHLERARRVVGDLVEDLDVERPAFRPRRGVDGTRAFPPPISGCRCGPAVIGIADLDGFVTEHGRAPRTECERRPVRGTFPEIDISICTQLYRVMDHLRHVEPSCASKCRDCDPLAARVDQGPEDGVKLGARHGAMSRSWAISLSGVASPLYHRVR